MTWLAAFVWTLALEQPIYTLWLHDHVRPWWLPCVLAVAANAATHPTLWFVWPRFDPYWCYVLVGETCVVVVETAIVVAVIGRRQLGRAFAASLSANTLSTAIGLVLAG